MSIIRNHAKFLSECAVKLHDVVFTSIELVYDFWLKDAKVAHLASAFEPEDIAIAPRYYRAGVRAIRLRCIDGENDDTFVVPLEKAKIGGILYFKAARESHRRQSRHDDIKKFMTFNHRDPLFSSQRR